MKKKCFLKDIENYWHCEGRDSDSGKDLLRALRHPGHDINETEFTELLADAILNASISVEEYLELTGAEFDDPRAVANDLLDLWRQMFGVERIPTL